VHFGTVVAPVPGPGLGLGEPAGPDGVLAEDGAGLGAGLAGAAVFRGRAGPGLRVRLVVTGRGRYVRTFSDAGLPLATAPATWPGSLRCAADPCPAVAPGAPGTTKSRTCGTAASAPSTATAGTALPAALARFCAREGAECRPFLLTFSCLWCAADLTNLPYAGTAPGYSANRASHQA
jgi:hypothetical protein